MKRLAVLTLMCVTCGFAAEQTVAEAKHKEKKDSVKRVGGGAASGAVIGALAGGKKGALIGAAAGGGTGAVYDHHKKKQEAKQQ